MAGQSRARQGNVGHSRDVSYRNVSKAYSYPILRVNPSKSSTGARKIYGKSAGSQLPVFYRKFYGIVLQCGCSVSQRVKDPSPAGTHHWNNVTLASMQIHDVVSTLMGSLYKRQMPTWRFLQAVNDSDQIAQMQRRLIFYLSTPLETAQSNVIDRYFFWIPPVSSLTHYSLETPKKG